MQHRIEPPILLSRLMLFVFAATVVVLFVLFMTMEKMFPLNRPQVFFVTTRPEADTVIQVVDMPVDDSSLEVYKQAFIMEYVRARNEVEKNASVMRQKWGNANGLVAAWSAPDVYDNFIKTGLPNAILNDYPDFEFNCPVRFKGRPLKVKPNQYSVKFEYFCENNNGQTMKKDYTIRIGLSVENGARVKWNQRLNNPLGIQVSEYILDGGGADPLDTVYRQ